MLPVAQPASMRTAVVVVVVDIVAAVVVAQAVCAAVAAVAAVVVDIVAAVVVAQVVCAAVAVQNIVSAARLLGSRTGTCSKWSTSPHTLGCRWESVAFGGCTF